MKKFAVLLLAFLYMNLAQGTHLAGGEITVHALVNGSFEIEFNLSRDTASASAALNQFKYSLYNSDFTYAYTKLISTQLINSTTLNGHPQNVELYRATDIVNSLAPGDYKVVIDKCCMPGPFNNASIDRDFYLECAFKVFGTFPENSSPTILSPAINVIPVNQRFTTNINTYDIDGDKVLIKIIHPLEGDSVQIPFWVPPGSDTSNVFRIDSVSGDISWTPNQIGRFLVVFEIQEYRNRILIGRVLRTQTFIVVPYSNHIPSINNFNTIPLNVHGYKYVNINPLQNYSLTLYASDIDQDSINVVAYGEPFQLSSGNALLSTSVQNTGQAQAVFTWTPDSASVRSKTYLVTFRVQDQSYGQDYSLFIRVGNLFPGKEDESLVSQFNLFPNPASSYIESNFYLRDNSKLLFRLLDNKGSLITELMKQYFSAGYHEVSIPLNIKSGLYFLQITDENKFVKSRSLIVNHE